MPTPKKTAEPKEKKERTPLDFSNITARVVTDPHELEELRPRRAVKDPEQIAVNQLVERAYDAWVEAGRPEDAFQGGALTVTIPEAQVDTLKWRLTRGGRRYNVRIRYGNIQVADEYATVSFVATERPVKADPETSE